MQGSFAALAVELAAAVIAPPRCAGCDTKVPILTVFCRACASTAEGSGLGWADTGAPFLYGGAIARAIVRMKYGNRPDLARPLGHLLWRAIEPHAAPLRRVGPGGRTVVVPVPLHPLRLAERGYNQSALLANRVARGLGAPFWPRALERLRDTPQQTTLDRGARDPNVRGAFRARNPGAVSGRDFLLVDDVWTTGATLDACARALLESGAGRVVRAAVARAPR